MSQSWIEKTRQRHVLRQIIKGEEALKAVMEISDRLHVEAATLGHTEVSALRAAADLKLKVLDKVLPDLKSVEHELGEGLTAMTEDELLERASQLTAALDPRIVSRIHAVAPGDSATVN